MDSARDFYSLDVGSIPTGDTNFYRRFIMRYGPSRRYMRVSHLMSYSTWVLLTSQSIFRRQALLPELFYSYFGG